MKKIFNAVKKWFYIKNDTEQTEINKQLVVIVVSIFVTVVSVLGVTYSAFVWSDNSLKNQSLIVGNVELSIDSSSVALGSSLNYPVAKEDEASLTPYTFTIKNNGILSSSYKLKIVADDAYTNTMDTNYIYMSMTGGRTINRTSLSSYSEIPFDEGILASGESKTYDLRLWIVENAPNSVIGKEWHGKIILESTQTDIIVDVDVSDLTLVSDTNINTESKNTEFAIKNSENVTKYLQLNLDKIAISDELKNVNFKWRLLEGDTVINEGDFNITSNNMLLQRGIEVAPNQEKKYNLLIWYSDSDTSGIDLTAKTLTAELTAELSDNLSEIAPSESPVLINTIANNPIKNFKIFGNSIQNGIPTLETPVEIESVGDESENLLKYGLSVHTGNTTSTRTKLVETLFKLEPGEYTLSFDTITNATTYRLYWVVFTDSAGTNEITDKSYVQINVADDSGYYNSNNKFFLTNRTFDISQNDIKISVMNTCYVSFMFGGGDTKSSGSTTPSVMINPKLQIGGKYTIPVKISGKNLFDRGTLPATNSRTKQYGEYGIEQVKTSTNSGYRFPIDIKKGTQFKLSYKLMDFVKISSANIRVYTRYYDKDGNRILTQSSGNIGTSSLNKTITLPTLTASDDIVSVEFYTQSAWVEGEGYTIDEIMITTSTNSDFEPYIEPVVTNIYLDEPLRKVGDYVDYIDFVNQKVVRNVEVVDNTGTLPLEDSLRGLQSPIEESIQLPSPVTMNGLTNITIDTKVKPLITGNY